MKTPKKRNPHTDLSKEVDKVLQARSDCFGWPNNTGAGLLNGKRYVKFGHKGSGDWIGITSDGRFISFEYKTGAARQTYDQRRFQEKIKSMGGRYYVIHSVEQVINILDSLGLTPDKITEAG